MEIYNEKLHDLLNPAAYGRGHGGSVGELRIRESPTLGPYVEGLTVSAVKSFEDLMLLMATGTTHRTIGATVSAPNIHTRIFGGILEGNLR